MHNTREKLIELMFVGQVLADAMCDKQEECDKCQYNAPNGCRCGFIADHLIANGVTFATDNDVGSKWIPVTERLPDSGIEVLAMLKVDKFDGHSAHNVTTAVIMPSGSWLVADYQEGIEAETAGADCEDCCYWITHWMPLPPAPKGE